MAGVQGREKNYILLPVTVCVRRNCLEEGMTVKLTEVQLRIPAFGDPSRIETKIGCTRKISMQETWNMRRDRLQTLLRNAEATAGHHPKSALKSNCESTTSLGIKSSADI